MIKSNYDKLKKRVFIKQRVEVKSPHKAFKNNKLQLINSQDALISVKEASLLTAMIDDVKDSSNDFLLPTPA